nr:serine/threonine-protein kinase HT1 isoform X1 [Tanacetum cinerariifolium]
MLVYAGYDKNIIFISYKKVEFILLYTCFCSGCSKSVCSNGSVTNSDCTIDERVLVDPKLLFIGAKIGEGAHGKVYEG